ncbi:hypothetical protein BC937DRAFT_90048 [Endogone sp. FLAS-F59071]|nr:hypothetical protein BC937DRAFT_90048 [Endogone sp. FLAS-F59071]|eukprot:RUS22192.1 hypothetical protein BC937DRAFT_90048 [Endogone sp. FLAS-F59071]
MGGGKRTLKIHRVSATSQFNAFAIGAPTKPGPNTLTVNHQSTINNFVRSFTYRPYVNFDQSVAGFSAARFRIISLEDGALYSIPTFTAFFTLWPHLRFLSLVSPGGSPIVKPLDILLAAPPSLDILDIRHVPETGRYTGPLCLLVPLKRLTLWSSYLANPFLVLTCSAPQLEYLNLRRSRKHNVHAPIGQRSKC